MGDPAWDGGGLNVPTRCDAWRVTHRRPADVVQPRGVGLDCGGGLLQTDPVTIGFVVVSMPDSATVAGGRTVTMPKLELTCQATGTSGTQSNWFQSELVNVTSATLIVSTTATFDGYPRPTRPISR